MSADDPKPENETEAPETLQEEQTAGGPPQDELDAEAPTTDAAGEDEAPASDEAPAEAEPVAEADADADAEAAAEEPEAEAKPKPRRKPAAKKPAAEKDEDAEKADDKPKAAPKAKKAEAASNGQPQVVRAQARYVRTSARKARLVCDHLRGKSVEEARAILLHTPRHVARDWSKLLESAVANAEHNHELVGDELRILSITADEGPTIKRFRPRAHGRASRIRKRTAHLSISLTSKES